MSWSEYFEKIKDRPVRPLLLNALKRVPETLPRTAIELGSGAGTDTLHLLNNGWNVIAVEKETSGIEYLRANLSSDLAGSLKVIKTDFESLDQHSDELSRCDLIYASLSLPFCDQKYFKDFWKVIEGCFGEKCVFAANFFGPEDEWVRDGRCTGHSELEIRTLLKDFTEVKISEYKALGPTALNGEKFWHIYDVIALKNLG